MKGGFADSPIRLNNSLAKLENWNETEILKRADILVTLATKIWTCPELAEEVLEGYKVVEEKVEKEYTISDHKHLAEDQPMRPLFDELRKRILNLDSSVKEEFLKLYVAYKATTNFVDIVPQKSKLRLSLNLKFEDINDPKGICKDITDVGRWGNGDVEVSISKVEDLDYILFLIKQSLDKNSEE
jgi:predicted transport protein